MPKPLPVLDTTAPGCCATLASGAMDETDALKIALRLKALAFPVRIRLMSLILAESDTGVCTCDLAPVVGVTEATVSHHMKQFRGAGLVEGTRKGTNTYYRPECCRIGRNGAGSSTLTAANAHVNGVWMTGLPDRLQLLVDGLLADLVPVRMSP